MGRHSMNHLQERIKDKSGSSRQSFRLSREEVEDLKLWKVFLEKARTGISMNLLTLRAPSLMAFSDSYPFGIGGYTSKGWAWRVRVPKMFGFWGHDSVNNMIKFLGMAVSIMLLIREAGGENCPCSLALGDNTSATGWLHRSRRLSKTSRRHEPANSLPGQWPEQ